MTRRVSRVGLAALTALALHAVLLLLLGLQVTHERDDDRAPSRFAAEIVPANPPPPIARGGGQRRQRPPAEPLPKAFQVADGPEVGRSVAAAGVDAAPLLSTSPTAEGTLTPPAPHEQTNTQPPVRPAPAASMTTRRPATLDTPAPLPPIQPGGRVVGRGYSVGQPGSAMTVGSGDTKAVAVGAPQSARMPATRPRHSQYMDYVPGQSASHAPGVNASTRATHGTGHGRESYEAFADNRFRSPMDEPLSTFAIDVDTASYSNIRRFITQGYRPPSDAVRVEEMINYFRYEYPDPEGDVPFAVYTEVGPAPWRPEHRLVHIGLQGRRVDHADRPASNLVFLLDVSGSMSSQDKLPLLKRAFSLLVGELDARDRVAIVTYAGHAGTALRPTSGAEKQEILSVVAGLGAGGSTAGAQGIEAAYELARRSFIPGGINRVILATDGDFNVGISDDGALVRMIEEKRAGGVFLTVLGFGQGNLQDAKMHKLADRGNGAYHYIDSIFEAKKVLIDEMGATLQTIAKDVKVQVEFNPAHVAAYRLVGYETRLLAAEDFADDKKDAGELGAGHTVTALYEVIPRGVDSPELARIHIPLKYQRQDLSETGAGELLTVKLRYKQPDEDVSSLLTQPVAAASRAGDCTDCFRFSAAVALFGMLLRESPAAGDATVSDALELARGSLGDDAGGYRRAFVDMVELYERQLATSLN